MAENPFGSYFDDPELLLRHAWDHVMDEMPFDGEGIAKSRALGCLSTARGVIARTNKEIEYVPLTREELMRWMEEQANAEPTER